MAKKKIVQEIELIAKVSKVKETAQKDFEDAIEKIQKAASPIAIKVDTKEAKKAVSDFLKTLQRDSLKGVNFSGLTTKFVSELLDEKKSSEEFTKFVNDITAKINNLTSLGKDTIDILPKFSAEQIDKLLDVDGLEQATKLANDFANALNNIGSGSGIAEIPKDIKEYIVSIEEAIKQIEKINPKVLKHKMSNGEVYSGPNIDDDSEDEKWQTAFKYAARLKSILGDEWVNSDIISKSKIQKDVLSIFEKWDDNVVVLTEKTLSQMDKIFEYKDFGSSNDSSVEKSNNTKNNQTKNNQVPKIDSTEIVNAINSSSDKIVDGVKSGLKEISGDVTSAIKDLNNKKLTLKDVFDSYNDADKKNADYYKKVNFVKGQIAERGFYYNSETGEMSNPFNNGSKVEVYSESSFQNGKSIKDYDTDIHTHPEYFASPSAGDLEAYYKELVEKGSKIKKALIIGLKDILDIDLAKFKDNPKDLLTLANKKQKSQLATNELIKKYTPELFGEVKSNVFDKGFVDQIIKKAQSQKYLVNDEDKKAFENNFFKELSKLDVSDINSIHVDGIKNKIIKVIEDALVDSVSDRNVIADYKSIVKELIPKTSKDGVAYIEKYKSILNTYGKQASLALIKDALSSIKNADGSQRYNPDEVFKVYKNADYFKQNPQMLKSFSNNGLSQNDFIKFDSSDIVNSIESASDKIVEAIKADQEGETEENKIRGILSSTNDKNKADNSDQENNSGLAQIINTAISNIQTDITSGSENIVTAVNNAAGSINEGLKNIKAIDVEGSNKKGSGGGKKKKENEEETTLDMYANLRKLKVKTWLQEFLRQSSTAAFADAKIKTLNGKIDEKVIAHKINGDPITIETPTDNGKDSLQVELQRQIREEAKRKLKVLLENMPKIDPEKNPELAEAFESIKSNGEYNSFHLKEMGAIVGKNKLDKDSLSWADKYLKTLKKIYDIKEKEVGIDSGSTKANNLKYQRDEANRALQKLKKDSKKYRDQANKLFTEIFGRSFDEYEKLTNQIGTQNRNNAVDNKIRDKVKTDVDDYIEAINTRARKQAELAKIGKDNNNALRVKDLTDAIEDQTNKIKELDIELEQHKQIANDVFDFENRKNIALAKGEELKKAGEQTYRNKTGKESNISNSDVDEINKQKKLAIKNLEKYEKINTENIPNINKYNDAIKNLKDGIAGLNNELSKSNPSKESEEYKEAIKKITNANNALSGDALKPFDFEKFKRDRATILNYFNKNSKAANFVGQNGITPEIIKAQLAEMNKSKGVGFSDQDRQNLVNSFVQLKGDIKEAGKEGANFFDTLKQRAQSFAAYMATFVSFQDFIFKIRQAISTVVQLNTQLVELSKVSEFSLRGLESQFKDFADISKEIGGTITDTISATADWSRNGYSLPEAKELARVAQLYKNVGDGIDINTANSSLISTLRGYEMEASEAEQIIDSFNEVANNFPISSAGIGTALERSAASFHAANTDLNKSIALVTATNSVLQDPEKAGNMWKTKFYCLNVQKCA